MNPPDQRSWRLARWQLALAGVAAIALMILIVRGLFGLDIRKNSVWPPDGFRNLKYYSYGYFWVTLLYLIFWRRHFARHLLFAGIIYAVSTAGPAGVLAAILFFASSFAIGDFLLEKFWGGVRTGTIDLLFATLTGTAVLIFVTGIAVHFPINYPIVYFSLLGAPVALRTRPLRSACRLLFSRAGSRRPMPMLDFGGVAVLGYVLLAHLGLVVKPEVSFDAMAMHLTIPAWVAKHHAWSFDFRNIAWAVMPMGGDWAFVAAYLTGGEFGARLLNFGLLLLTCALMCCVMRRWIARGPALLLVAAFASTPATFLVTGSMFIDNMLTVMLLGAVLSLCYFRFTGNSRYLLACGSMIGAALATKLGALPLGVVLTAVMIAAAWRGAPRAVVLSLLALLVTGSYQFVYAWMATGNPIFPFPNRWFHAEHGLPFPFYAAFNQKLTLTTLYDLTFSTSKYLEALDGGFGITYFFLFPLGLIAVLRGAPMARFVYACGAGMFLAIFATQPYIRYIHPAFPMLIIPCAAYFGHDKTLTNWVRLPLAAVITLGILVNVYLLPRGNIYHSQFAFSPFAYTEKSERYIAEMAPARVLLRYANMIAPGEPIVFLGNAPVYANDSFSLSDAWHHHRFSDALINNPNATEIAKLIRKRGFRYLISTPLVAIKQQPLREVVKDYAQTVFTVNGWSLVRLIDDPDRTRPKHPEQELLSNGEFQQQFNDWQLNGAPELVATTHEVRVTGKDTVIRKIAIDPAEQYFYTLRAKCEGAKNLLRLQINWHDAGDRFISTQLEPHSCGAEYADYKTVMRPPPNAVSGIVIVAGHTDQGVWVDSVSLKK